MADPLSRLILHAKQPLPPGSSCMRQDSGLPRCIGVRHSDGICITPRRLSAADAVIGSRAIIRAKSNRGIRSDWLPVSPRTREFFRRLKEILANDDPDQKDRMVDEFRALILGR